MSIDFQKLEKLLMGTPQYFDLGLKILSGLQAQAKDLEVLLPYYHQLFQEYGKVNSWQSAIYGQQGIPANRSSRYLTVLLNGLEAEQAIELTRSLFLTEKTLSLPRLEWEVLPTWIYQIKEIETFNFQDGVLNTISDEIVHFKKLKEINLLNQPIATISPQIASLKQLETIHLKSGFMVTDELMDMEHLDIIIDAAY